MPRRLVHVLLALVLGCAVLVSGPGQAAGPTGGGFDPSFGTGGVATAPASGTLPTTNAAALAIDGAGRIVTAGDVYDTANSRYVLTVHRFLPSGAIDTTFGSGGLAKVPITSGWDINTVTGVGVQPSGRIVVGARVYQTSDPNNTGKFGVVGLTTGGALDADFDGGIAGNGVLILTVAPIAPPAAIETARKLTVDETGRILMSGLGYYSTSPAKVRATMARLNPDGTFDTTFSGDGKVDVLLPTTDSDMKGFADLPGANGYALGGRTIPNVAPTTPQPTVIRVAENGDLVTTFGSSLSSTQGMSTTYWQSDPTKFAEINALVGVPGGGIVAGGYQNQTSPAPSFAALAKYTATGALDPTFGTGGVTLFQPTVAYSAVTDLAVQPDGKILAALYSGSSNGYVARFTAAGALDPTFGSGGLVAVDPTTGTVALTLQNDGKTVAITPRGQSNTTLVRLLGDHAVVAPSIQITSPAGGKVKAKKVKSFSGAASGDQAAVQVAVRRIDKHQLKAKHRCLWLKNDRARFAKVRAVGKTCASPLYLPASGVSTWTYALRKALPKGKYLLYAQVVLPDGRTAMASNPFKVT